MWLHYEWRVNRQTLPPSIMNMTRYPYPLPSSTGNLIPPKRQNKNASSIDDSELERALGSIWRKRISFLSALVRNESARMRNESARVRNAGVDYQDFALSLSFSTEERCRECGWLFVAFGRMIHGSFTRSAEATRMMPSTEGWFEYSSQSAFSSPNDQEGAE